MAGGVCDNGEERVTKPSLLTSRIEEMKPLLVGSLPWSPLDFIKGISPDGDRQVQCEPLLRDLPPEDDLRFTCPVTAVGDVLVSAERLRWDSTFFGYGVARFHGVFPLTPGAYRQTADYAPAIGTLCQLARTRGIKYLFGVVDARDQPTTRALAAAGFTLIESRLYYHRPLRNYHYRRRYQCRAAREGDIENLTRLAQSVENPYDRFNADPFIARADAQRLMATWIRASILQGFADATFVPDDEEPAAVCTLRYHRDRWATWGISIAQLMLAIASPRMGGSLLRLLSEVTYHLKDVGADHVFCTTQITNRSAIRVGEHLGYMFGRGEYVFRILL
jgi:dTDP-4-amino-4,6-dideoxy-D-galactose acyltransferase